MSANSMGDVPVRVRVEDKPEMSVFVNTDMMPNFYAVVKDAFQEAQSALPKEYMEKLRGTPEPETWIKQIIARQAGKEYKYEEPGFVENGATLELTPEDMVYDLRTTFGNKFVEGLKSIGGKFFVDFDVEIVARGEYGHPLYKEDMKVSIRGFEFDSNQSWEKPATPGALASNLRKIASYIEKSNYPSRSDVITGLKKILSSMNY